MNTNDQLDLRRAMNTNDPLDLHRALIRAVQNSDSVSIHRLASRGAPIQNLLQGKKNPLISACIIGEYNIVQQLLDYGADPDAKDGNNDTPLIWAAYMDHPGTVERLIRAKANVEALGYKQLRAIEVAVERKHPDVIKVLRTMHYEPLFRSIRDELKSASYSEVGQRYIIQYCTPLW